MEIMKQLREEIESLKKEVAELKAQPREFRYYFCQSENPWYVYKTGTGTSPDSLMRMA